ncbi:MAG: SLC13 family permease [Myxococcota bacterium]
MKLKAPSSGTISKLGLMLGPIIAAVVFWSMPDSYTTPGGEVQMLGESGRAAAAVAAWMATWWLTEAIHIAATALLPLALFPLTGARTIESAAAPYANDIIYLFLGGFLLSLSMQRWNLHKRVALITLQFVGTKPARIVGGFMLVTAVLSMWVSNTATAVMMLPIAVSVIQLVLPGDHEAVPTDSDDDLSRNFAVAMLLGIAYAASIGGLGTIIGSPPNVFVVSYVRDNMATDIGFAKWMSFGLPLVAVFLPLTWWLLTRVLHPVAGEGLDSTRELLVEQLRALGKLSRGEWATMAAFVGAAGAWIFRPLLQKINIAGVQPLAGLTDAGIAMLASLMLFVIPANSDDHDRVMDWDAARDVPWGILILFGGGLSLADALEKNGVSAFLAANVGALAALPEVVIVLAATMLVVFLTELTSNTATTATLVPILGGMAVGLGLSPYMLILPAALAASCAFMMPVATPPNAIVFGSGHIRIGQMARAGVLLNFIGIGLVVLLMYALLVPMLGL